MKHAIDKLTGEVFIPKRRNQEFISSKTRIQYNNLRAAEIRKNKAIEEQKIKEDYLKLKKQVSINKHINKKSCLYRIKEYEDIYGNKEFIAQRKLFWIFWVNLPDARNSSYSKQHYEKIISDDKRKRGFNLKIINEID
jgi:hypothetical protein